ncbi:phosphoheptose isomerase [Neisseria gonorrhoeae]|uniref:Phosphoheptose isomerase n=1 Tax=Neisseria gonorrhoeae TaxID=485 RepID=A0A378W3C9_NEIGO|nr:phosphoheptose isomerase [Neisseria gonorrhoeae]
MTTLQERVAAHFAESIRAKQEAEKYWSSRPYRLPS